MTVTSFLADHSTDGLKERGLEKESGPCSTRWGLCSTKPTFATIVKATLGRKLTDRAEHVWGFASTERHLEGKQKLLTDMSKSCLKKCCDTFFCWGCYNDEFMCSTNQLQPTHVFVLCPPQKYPFMCLYCVHLKSTHSCVCTVSTSKVLLSISTASMAQQ